jgi:hypothetical protein
LMSWMSLKTRPLVKGFFFLAHLQYRRRHSVYPAGKQKISTNQVLIEQEKYKGVAFHLRPLAPLEPD